VVDYDAVARQWRPVRAVAQVVVGTLAVLAVAYGLLVQLGLPDWVFVATVAVLVVALPVLLLTSFHERKRAWAQTIGTRVPTPTGVERHFRWNKALGGTGMAFALLAVGAGVYMAMRLLGIGPVGTLVASGVLEQRERLVVALFENATPDTTLAETVTELLHVDLAQSPTVTVMEAAQVGTVLSRMERGPDEALTLELATEVAEREGIKAVVAGEIRSLGGGYVLSARLIAAGTRDILWAGRENAANADEVIEAVDRLSADLRGRIGESLRTIRSDPPLARVTTRSTVALRKFIEGQRASSLGDYDRAITLLEEAIAEDSGFAMAWRYLGVVLANTGRDPDRRDSAFSRAMELRDRLTERERYLCEGAYYNYVEDNAQAAAGALRSVLAKYPDDRAALNNLANYYSSLGRNEEAAALRMRSIALGHAPAVTYQGAIGILYELGKPDSARRVLELFAAEYPDHPYVLRFGASFESATRQYDSARAILQHLQTSQRGNPQWEMRVAWDLSEVAFVRGKLAESWRHLRTARARAEELGLRWTQLRPYDVWERETHAWRLLDHHVDRPAALRLMDSRLRDHPLESLAPEDRPYLMLVRFYAQAGESARAREFLEIFEAEVDAETREDRKWERHRARGLVALAEDRYEDAIAELQLEREAAPGCVLCALSGLAEAFDRRGNSDSAVAYYERYLTASSIVRVSADQHILWSTLRRLGELYEQRRDQDNAVRYYNEFVELWNDADPELQPQVEDVRQRIARLVSEPQR
jgi:tetratricopeptide (TPR) repeat protein